MNTHPSDLDADVDPVRPRAPLPPPPAFIARRAPEQPPPGTSMVEARPSEVAEGPGASGPADPLAELADLIRQPPRTPEVGVRASEAMAMAFETVAKEIEAVARDGVVRAEENLQEALSFVAVIRQTRDLLCSRIEGEAVRALQISRVMREARSAFASPEVETGQN